MPELRGTNVTDFTPLDIDLDAVPYRYAYDFFQECWCKSLLCDRQVSRDKALERQRLEQLKERERKRQEERQNNVSNYFIISSFNFALTFCLFCFFEFD
jgi:hypothetical protein